MGQEFGSRLAGLFQCRGSWYYNLDVCWGQWHLKAEQGLGGSLTQLANWQEAIDLLHRSHSAMPLPVPITEQITTPKEGDSGGQDRAANVICDLVRSHLVTTGQFWINVGELTREEIPWGKDHQGHQGGWLSHHLLSYKLVELVATLGLCTCCLPLLNGKKSFL